jgi:hypothetical protein
VRVSATKAPVHASLPWSVRLFAAAPLPLPVCALLVTIGWALADALYSLAFGLPFLEQFIEIELLQITMIGLTPAATAYALRGAERDLAELRPLLRSGVSPADDGLARVLSIGRLQLFANGLAGVALALFFLFSPASWESGRPAVSDPIFVWAMLRSVVLGWLVVRMVAIELSVAAGFSRLGEHGVAVEWLDQRPLAPFARKGLRSVFLLLIYWLLFSLFLLQPWGRFVAIPMLVLFPALCVFALLLPVSGVHRRLVAVKQQELARVDAALRAEAEANLAAGGAGGGAKLSNLVAYRGLVGAAGTWPFDVSVWLRFALYVSLGLGSWLGGAVVERLLGAALD